MHSNRGFGGTWAETFDGSWKVFVWGWKRPQSMPATYAPGPRCNATNDTKAFWACQAPNTTYLVSRCAYTPHVGGLPVEILAQELGTGWVDPGYKGAKPPYLSWSTRASEKVSVETSGAGGSATWMLWAEARIRAETCLPSPYAFWSIVTARWSLFSSTPSRTSRWRSTSIRADCIFSMSTVRAN